MVAVELRATYRVQLHAGFGFDEAAALTDYLAALGVSHLYSSPALQAAPGSTHGYDVVDPTRVSADLGGPAAHARLAGALAQHGLGQVLDIVPNHMAIGTRENAWWWDVLANGPASRYADYFDVDWDAPEARLRNTVLLPILGDHYGRVLEAGEIRLVREGAVFTVQYYEHVAPVALASLDGLLAAAAERAGADELAFIADALRRLPSVTATDADRLIRRHRDLAVLQGYLARLLETDPRVAAAVEAVVNEVNADVDALDALLERQSYRLAYWRTAGRELDYRRFFDINTLVGLCVEEEQVFADTHSLVLGWLNLGLLDGLRIDHVDGLRDPEAYLRRLRTAASGAWIVVEKILEHGERLPPAWPAAGTTGYDFLNQVGGLFVDPAGEGPLTELYTAFTGQSGDWGEVMRARKALAVREVLAADLNRLTAVFMEVCERQRRYRDYTRHELHEVLRAVAVHFPVYRAYVRAEAGIVGDEDVRVVNAAIEDARAARPDLDPDLFDFFRDLLLLRIRGERESELVMRFQQFTGPAMAKGVEDTAFYAYARLLSLNEVGGDPGHVGVGLAEFHAGCLQTQAAWPRTMLTTATHDTKRGEDTRLRISLLGEIPARWGEAVGRWATHNERHRRDGWPDRNAEYLYYQTLVGAWPLSVERALAYMEKAVREAKTHTSWTEQDPAYEAAVRAFVEATLADAEFTAAVAAFVAPLVEPARIHSLAQTLIKLTAPGVPDIYQGCELWDHSLVDPDNRRPVDYARRRELLAALDGMTPEAIWARHAEGLPKLFVIRQALALRRRQPDRFGPAGAYRPLAARGPQADRVVAFARGEAVITVAPRLVLGLGGDWGETALDLPPGRWCDQFSGDVHTGPARLADLLGRFPVALLAREEAS